MKIYIKCACGHIQEIDVETIEDKQTFAEWRAQSDCDDCLE